MLHRNCQKKHCKSQWHVETLGFQLQMTGLPFHLQLLIFLSQESPILGSYKTLSLGYGPSKMSKLRTITPATFPTKMPTQLFLKFSAWGGVVQGWPKTLNFFSGEELPPVVKKANDQEDDQKDHASRSPNHTHAQPQFDGRCVQEACLFRGAAEGVGQDSNKKEVGQR